MTKPTIEQLAKLFGCTPDQVRAQFAKSVAGLESDAAKAEATGKKVRGSTAERLRELAAEARARSVE